VQTAKPVGPSARRQVLPTSLVVPEPGLELLQRLGEIRPAHPATLSVGPFGVNPIGTTYFRTRTHEVLSRTCTPGEAAASGRKNPETFTTGVSVRFLLAGALLTSYHRAVCEAGRTNQNSGFKEVHW